MKKEVKNGASLKNRALNMNSMNKVRGGGVNGRNPQTGAEISIPQK